MRNQPEESAGANLCNHTNEKRKIDEGVMDNILMVPTYLVVSSKNFLRQFTPVLQKPLPLLQLTISHAKKSRFYFADGMHPEHRKKSGYHHR